MRSNLTFSSINEHAKANRLDRLTQLLELAKKKNFTGETSEGISASQNLERKEWLFLKQLYLKKLGRSIVFLQKLGRGYEESPFVSNGRER